MFGAWGRLVYRWRWLVLIVSLIAVAASGIAIVRFNTSLVNADTEITGSESSRARELMREELPQEDSGGSFTLVFTANDSTLKATDPAFTAAVEAALQPLRTDPRIKTISLNPAFVSKDGRRSFAIVSTTDPRRASEKYYEELREKVQSPTLEILSTGNLPINADFAKVTEQDLQKAEVVGLPIALVILLLVFGTTLWRTIRRTSLRGAAAILTLAVGSLLIALIPLLIGGFSILGGIAGIYAFAHKREMAIYSLNIASMVGLGLAIDYSLFIISRFLDEVAVRPVAEAVERTIATTGKSIAFSGLTVAIGVGGLLFYRSALLTSIGLSAMIVVCTAVFYGLTFLPALLSIIGNGVTRRLLRRGDGTTAPPVSTTPIVQRTSAWQRLANMVMAHPWAVLLPLLAILLLAGSPVLRLRMSASDITTLPPQVESRRGYDILTKEFPGSEDTPIPVVINFADGQPLTAKRIEQLYDYATWLSTLPNVRNVQSAILLKGPDGKTLPKEQVVAALTAPAASQPAALREGLRQSVGAHIVSMVVQTPLAGNSKEAEELVRQIRAGGGPAVDGQRLVGGFPAITIDSIDTLLADTRGAVAFIMIATYIVLFLLLGSIVLPLKAVVMNLLSISASYGALVFIFQEGHLSGLMNFTPGPIEPVVPVLMFCLLFGLSMDYEVLLLSRMKEEHERLGDNRAAVAMGLEHTGQLITGAAAIMIAVFSAFALADIVIIKAIGLGMALAVAIDALVVRTLVVPATMRLLGEWNWWAPAPLVRLYQRLGMAENSGVEPVPVTTATE